MTGKFYFSSALRLPSSPDQLSLFFHSLSPLFITSNAVSLPEPLFLLLLHCSSQLRKTTSPLRSVTQFTAEGFLTFPAPTHRHRYRSFPLFLLFHTFLVSSHHYQRVQFQRTVNRSLLLCRRYAKTNDSLTHTIMST